jgi:hypothetical protein
VRDQGAGEVEAALHAAGVGLGHPVTGLGQVEHLQQLLGPGRGRLGVEAVEPAEHPEVLAAGEVLVDGAVLAGQADHPAYEPRLGRHVVPEHPRLTRIGLEQRGEHAHGRGLACPVGAEQAEHRAG